MALILTAGASAFGHFALQSVIYRAAEAATNHKDSEEVLCESVGLEEYDLTVGVYETR